MNAPATTQQRKIPSTELRERGVEALDPSEYADLPVVIEPKAGQVSSVNIESVMKLAVLLASSQEAIAPHCRGNKGICLRIAFQAVEWQMSPFSLSDQTYIVNNRLAYMSQVIHAVVEARAPLRERLICEYSGEYVYDEVEQKDPNTGERYTVRVLNQRKSDRRCKVTGVFLNGTSREYETPAYCDIRVKNSPLWKDDPDQQLFYYGSRSWARKWAPEILTGVYTGEEIRAYPNVGMEEVPPQGSGIRAKLEAGEPDRSEGHRPGHVEAELASVSSMASGAQIAPGDQTEEQRQPQRTRKQNKGKGATKPSPQKGPHRGRRGQAEPSEPKPGPETQPAQPKPGNLPPDEKVVQRVADRAEVKPEPPKPPPVPKTVIEYVNHALNWIGESDDVAKMEQRWRDERSLRNNVGMTAEDRQPLEAALFQRRQKLEE